MRKLLAITVIWAMSFAAPAAAQDTADFVIGFEGEVTTAPGGPFQFIRPISELPFNTSSTSSSGGSTSFGGRSGPVVDLPDYPATVGDAFGVVISASLPTPEGFASGAFDNFKQADGTFLVPLRRSGVPGADGTNTGGITSIAASGPFRTLDEARHGQAPFPFPQVIFDPADGSYTIGQNSPWAFGTFIASPLGTYVYDPDTNSAVLTGTFCTGPDCIPPSSALRLMSNALGFVQGVVPILSRGRQLNPIDDAPFRADGTFFVRPASATQVPAPPMMLIFAAGAFAIMRRRRKMAALTT